MGNPGKSHTLIEADNNNVSGSNCEVNKRPMKNKLDVLGLEGKQMVVAAS